VYVQDDTKKIAKALLHLSKCKAKVQSKMIALAKQHYHYFGSAINQVLVTSLPLRNMGVKEKVLKCYIGMLLSELILFVVLLALKIG
jgi:hypothetical protein